MSIPRHDGGHRRRLHRRHDPVHPGARRPVEPGDARRGNLYGIVGMAIAVLATIVSRSGIAGRIVLLVVVGAMASAAVGLCRARTVQMTQMPELVALMHSLVGLAAMLVGLNELPRHRPSGRHARRIRAGHPSRRDLHRRLDRRGHVLRIGHRVRKLSARISGKPLLLPGRHCDQPRRLAGRSSWFDRVVRASPPISPACCSLVMSTRAAVRPAPGDGDRRRRHAGRRLDAQQLFGLGGGGDWLHADNDLLIVTGALVGSSGAILSYIMCRR